MLETHCWFSSLQRCVVIPCNEESAGILFFFSAPLKDGDPTLSDLLPDQSSPQDGLGSGVAAEDRALHRGGPAGVGPRARQIEAGHGRFGGQAMRR